MRNPEFKTRAAELVELIVNFIADKEYDKLPAVAKIDPSWTGSGQTQEQAFAEFGEWLDGQLAMWEEDEEKPFVIDRFDESQLSGLELEEDNRAFAEYNPTNSGEALDLWFEISFTVDENDRISAEINVNI